MQLVANTRRDCPAGIQCTDKSSIALTLILCLTAWLLAVPTSTAEDPDATQDAFWGPTPITLSAEEIDSLQAQLVGLHPELASSPGIKNISASRWPASETSTVRQEAVKQGDSAVIFFWPYAERRGIKLSLLARCWRPNLQGDWDCHHVQPRHYVQLEGQHFEVRVSDLLSLSIVEALREATHPLFAALPPEDHAAMLTVSEHDAEGIWVTWGTAEGYTRSVAAARLRDGADPARAASWQVEILQPQE